MHPTAFRSSPSAWASLTTRAATLVVIEFSASWPRWLKPTRGGDMAVVAQHYEGPPSDLISQVANRVMRLESRGWDLSAIVLVSNGRADVDTVAARSVLARGLLARLASGGGGHFALSVEERLGRRASYSLTARAAGLEPSARAGDVTLHVRGNVTDLASGAPSVLRRAS